jgi:hypothetical protein
MSSSQTPAELAADPLFQLNCVIWLTQPLAGGHRIQPILHQAGFTVYSLAPLLTPPPDLTAKAREGGFGIQNGTRPDLVLADALVEKVAVTECKASWFGSASHKAEQARALLISSGERCGDVLGVAAGQVKEAIFLAVLPEDRSAQAATSLAELREELGSCGVPPPTVSVAGLEIGSTEASVEFDVAAAAFFGVPAGRHVFLRYDSPDDARPLYFVPYDPTHTPGSAHEPIARRILLERLHGSVLGTIARALPPTAVVIRPDEALNDAMFGMWNLWEDVEAHRAMKRLFRDFMTRLVRQLDEGVRPFIEGQQNGEWRVRLTDASVHALVRDEIARFLAEDAATAPEPRPSLLDDLADS